MLYQLKSQPSDFIVEELLPALPSGKGDVFFVYFEKTNLTTMEVLDHLQRQLSLPREDLGIAGLKDKAGITRQWISIFHSALDRARGRDRFLSALSEVVKVVQTTRGEKPLRVGTNSGNKFSIRLRATQPVSLEQKNLIEQHIEKIQEKGFPNCFGSQRFGKKNKNFTEAKEFFTNPPIDENTYQLRFMLQAYASMYFNEYVMQRREKGLHLLGGDIVTDRYYATGAHIGVYQNQEIQLFDYLALKEKNTEKPFFEPLLLGDIGQGKPTPYNSSFIPT
jgi:tRNA pseudouridine13 synthase